MSIKNFIEKRFQLSARNSSVSSELVGAFTTFAAMSYILAVNPAILGTTGMDKQCLVTVTALAAAIGCALMAFLANLPVALAPAMGTNSYFAIIICAGMGLRWQEALALTFYNGIFFLAISLSGLRKKLIYAVPRPLQIGLQCGIGVFIAFFGLQSAKIIVRDENTLVTAGQLGSPECLFCLLGIALMAVLMIWRFKGAIIGTIIFLTMLAFMVDDSSGERMAVAPDSIFSLPHGISETFMQLDFAYPIKNFSKAAPVIFVLLMLDLLDTMATVIAMGRRTGLMDDKGRMPKLDMALTADAGATIAGALLGTSTTGSYVESAAGIESGARTGLSALAVGFLFLLSLFLSPIINSVPPEATAPALVLVGIMMMQGLSELRFNDMAELLPAMLCMLMIAFSFKISEGFAFGVAAYVILLSATGRAGQISATTWFLFALMCVFLCAL